MSPPLADRLAAIHAEAFDAPWDAAAFTDLMGRAGVTVHAGADGFILIRTVGDEAEILTLAVRPRVRRQGLGRRLVDAAAATARAEGADRLFLEVGEGNTAARSLYVAAGFVPAGRRKGYYRRPGGGAEDALILALNLAGRLP